MERSQERLREDGFTDDEISRVFDAVPVATHNQRGIGTLHIGCPESCTEALEAETLLQIVESAMSSEVYELMKRSDEVEVVEKAHLRPRFVEDCVREMVRMATERFARLGPPGEPRDDPQAQRGGRAPRPDGRARERDRVRRTGRPRRDDPRLARGGPAAGPFAITSVARPSGQTGFHGSAAGGSLPMRSRHTDSRRRRRS